MNQRRDFLKTAFLAMGGLSLPGAIPRLSAAQSGLGNAGGPPMRFIFMHRGNGLFPKVMVPPSFGADLMKKEKANEPYEVDLDGHDLPEKTLIETFRSPKGWGGPGPKQLDPLVRGPHSIIFLGKGGPLGGCWITMAVRLPPLRL
jgi:hypothetical protein